MDRRLLKHHLRHYEKRRYSDRERLPKSYVITRRKMEIEIAAEEEREREYWKHVDIHFIIVRPNDVVFDNPILDTLLKTDSGV